MPKRRQHQIVQWKITLPANLAARVELRLPPNPANTGPGYGTRGDLIAALLSDWLEATEAQTALEEYHKDGGISLAEVKSELNIN